MIEYKEGAIVVVRGVRELFYVVFIEKSIVGVSRINQNLGREIIFCVPVDSVFIDESGCCFADSAHRVWGTVGNTDNECRIATYEELVAYIVDLTYHNNLPLIWQD